MSGPAAGAVGHFDPCAPLGPAAVALEASAGTGKTHALAGLATRLLAEGRVTAAELLMVTFTRAATGELRSRVRNRVSDAEAHLSAVLAGKDGATDDEVLGWLASEDAPGDRSGRRENLARALAEFDAATITTIHGFAAQVLAALGVGAGVGGPLALVDDLDQRVREVCSDLLVTAAVEPGPAAGLPGLKKLTERVKIVLSAPGTVVVPVAGDTAKADDLLTAELVRTAVQEVRRRRSDSGTQGFDDLLLRVRDLLRSPGSAAAVATLRSRFKAVLIDEFQDTDPVQWEIFERLFTPGDGSRCSLVLVGDPKQAIYSFRGADVGTYAAALAETPGLSRRGLVTNWRSDPEVIEATAALFGGADFGEGIAFTDVAAAPLRRPGLLRRASGDTVAALEVRCGTGAGLPAEPAAAAARAAVYADIVAHAVDLLDNASLPTGEPVRPGDIAVLTRSNLDGDAVQACLTAAGVPAVMARGTSVSTSPAAMQMTWLLEAMVRPSDPGRARTFTLSWFGGWEPAHLVTATDAEMTDVQEALHRWSRILTTRGVTELLRAVWDESGVVSRVLRLPDGDRSVTDLAHLAELLRVEAGSRPMSPAGLLALLGSLAGSAELMTDTDRDTDVTSRRVESDSAAVQIMTVWVAKGLEFPVVLCPTLWSHPPGGPLRYHDPGTGRRTLDVRTGSAMPARDPVARRACELAGEEARGEEMRLLYVALTRARHHTALWWIGTDRGPRETNLTRLLFGGAGPADPADVDAALTPLVRRAGGTVSVTRFGAPPDRGPRWTPPSADGHVPPLEAARFSRPTPLDRSRSRWSFSAIVSRDRTAGDPWDLSVDDEGADDEQRPPDAEPALLDPPVPEPSAAAIAVSALATLPAGAAFGTLAHDVLERVDFASPDLTGELAGIVAEQKRWRSTMLHPVDDPRPWGDPGAEADGAALLVDGLAQAVTTPLGPLFDGGRLADVARGDRLSELSFEMPLGRPAATDRRVGEVLADNLAADDPFRAWAEGLARGRFGVELAGHLTGSVDLVVRLAGDRFVVIDHKTNRLHEPGGAPRPGDYGRAAMVRSMVEHHYPLQAALYLVALHRYLRWRLAGYSPAEHLGGAAYLFLRGMAGADTAAGEGVVSWRPPASAVEQLSDLLAGEPS